jgi:Fic family protein
MLAAYAEVFVVPKATASNDLRALAERGVLRALGRKRTLRYVLVGDADEDASS